MSGSSTRLDGSLITNVVLDAVTCGGGSTCRIETQAALELVEPYESSCMNRSIFGSPVSSDYLLPWRTGRTYRVSNSYCMPTGGHRQQLAYDFAIPIGDQVLAARAGIVRELQETFPDGGEGSDPNFVIIEHEDGTSAYYAHLKRNSVSVEVGATVEAGQVIALAGHSGTTDMAHLHFGVYSDYPPVEGQDEPVNFRDAEGPLDCHGGLVQDAVYTSR
jgi:murein DD-endopeptidase MepM/ murein hydrolase activator NlpD